MSDSEAGGRQVPTLKLVDGVLIVPSERQPMLESRYDWMKCRFNKIVQAIAGCGIGNTPKEWTDEAMWLMEELKTLGTLKAPGAREQPK
jgi:hypothetical protein